MILQLEASKLSIKDLFSNLLNEIKGFKYQITVKVLLKNTNSIKRLVINHRFKLEESFQETLYRIDCWINEGSGWIIESIESQYINISSYRPLLGSSYIELPIELRNPRKGLIDIKNKDQKCFLWCHVRHINPLKEHPGKKERKLLKDLPLILIITILKRLKYKVIFLLMYLAMRISWFFRFMFPMNLLLLIKDNKSHYVYIKDFNRFMFHKTKNKNKKWFCKSCLQCFSGEKVLIKHKEDCLNINGVQSVKVEEGIIKFENYFKQLPVPFKIYADFECNLKNVEIYEGSYTKKYHNHIPCSYAYKIVCIDDRFSKSIVVYRVKMLLMNLLEQFLKSISIVKK